MRQSASLAIYGTGHVMTRLSTDWIHSSKSRASRYIQLYNISIQVLYYATIITHKY